MTKLVRTVLLFAFLPLCGCAQIWAKPGGTSADLASAKAECERQASASFPPSIERVEVTPSSTTPIQTNCTTTFGVQSCTTTGGSWTPATYRYDDGNQRARDGAVRSCLIAAGWQPVNNKEEALTVTNSLPPTSRVGR